MRHHMVEEIMTRDVVSVSPATGFHAIVQAMADRAVSAVPVLDASGQPVGIVSEADLLHKEEFKDWGSDIRPLWERKARRHARRRSAAVTAREVMTSPVICVSRYERISEAARIMALSKIKRLPVVDADGAVIGIVSRSDLLRMFLRRDGDIREEIEEEVVRRALWEDPTRVHVEVTAGTVLLTGAVGVASNIPLAVRLARAVDGVIDVREELSFDQDDTIERTRSYL